MTLDDYLSLFPGHTREKTRFMALAEVVLRQALDLVSLTGSLGSAFSPETAQGVQLDQVAASMGLFRTDISVNEAVSDETFRDYILKKLNLWTWDGTNGSVPATLAKIQPGAEMLDNQDGTATVTGAGIQPVPVEELFPVTGGVRIV